MLFNNPINAADRTLFIIFAILLALTLLGLISCTGERGHPGANGSNGTAPVVSARPATLTECPTGGVFVLVGNQAPSIICNGTDGLVGAPGMATLVAPIKLCPGDTVYPSVFVEYALCIEDNLYGVYSANNGFLTVLQPGNYSSNAIHSSCNFTVAPHCMVTQ